MALDCTTSYVDVTEACDGRVLVCLQDTDGTAYFDSFDINGGPATGVGGTTGFTAAGNTPPYTQDYTVANEPANFQCFYVPYNVGAHSSDTLVIQATDATNTPVGDACELNFNVENTTGCISTNPPVCATGNINVNAGATIPSTILATGGTLPFQIAAFTTPTPLIVSTGSAITVDATTPTGQYNVAYTILDANNESVACNRTISVIQLNDACIDEAASSITVSPASGTATTTFTIDTTGVVTTSTYLVILKNGGSEYVALPSAGTSRTWTPPVNCTDGTYTICIRVAGCDDWIPANGQIQVSGCPELDCNQAVVSSSVSTVAGGTSMTFTAVGCTCGDCSGIEWSLPDGVQTDSNGNVVPLNPAVMTLPVTTAYAITVTPPAVAGTYRVIARCTGDCCA